MRRRKNKKNSAGPAAALLALVLGVPLLWYGGAASGLSLGKFGQKAAVLSAMLTMPEAGLDLLEERFRSDLINPEDYAHEVPTERPKQEDAPTQPFIARPFNDSALQNHPSPQESVQLPEIPEEYRAPILSEDFSGQPGKGLLEHGKGFLKNDTKETPKTVEQILGKDLPFAFTGGDEPEVLIFHTHATESFEPYDSPYHDIRNTWRSVDNTNNMAAVGAVFAQTLEEAGISVLHDTVQHDYPSYNGSYVRSAKTVQSYLEEYPSIKVVLDLHRDAMERAENEVVKPVAVIDGKKAAQIMIISGCDDGTMNMPHWDKNLRFAAEFQHYMEDLAPGLTRPVYFCYRKYNMDLSPGALLLEIGSNGNTLEEAMYSARLSATALSELIKDNLE